MNAPKWFPRYFRPWIPRVLPVFPNLRDVLPPGESGDVEIYYRPCDAKRAEIDYWVRNELWIPGEHCQLDISGVGWMFDSYHEKCMNLAAVKDARGNVLIGGLGLGLILWPILAKRTVRSVLVLENSEDVLRLVGPSLDKHPNRDKLSIEIADARTWEPPEGRSFDSVWLDCVPAYGYNGRIFELQTEWVTRYQRFASPRGRVNHWGYEENILYRLHGEGPTEEWPSVDQRPHPIGPPDPMAVAIASTHNYGPFGLKKGTDMFAFLEDCKPAPLNR